MLFLFYLVTTCLAVPVEKVHQVLDNKDASIVDKELLTKLKSSNGEFSKSLITSLVDAEPDAVNNVKRLVQALIAAGEGEREKYTQDRDTKQGTFDTAEAVLAADTLAHTTAAGELSDGRGEVVRLTGVKATAKTAKDEAKAAYDEAVSKFNEAAANLVSETNRVDTEKATLEEIRRLLNTLLPAEEGCDEARGLDNQFPVIAGAKWELTNNWDCGGRDISWQRAPSWDGSENAIASRMDCAQKCLDAPDCKSFNYPQEGLNTCYWKRSFQKSTELGKDCGYSKSDWAFYTLLDRTHCDVIDCQNYNQVPTYEDFHFLEWRGGQSPMTATNVCKFLGMEKAPEQPDQQVKNSYRLTVPADYRPESDCDLDRCVNPSSYSSMEKCDRVTRNGITFCLWTYSEPNSEPVWNKMRCQCTG